MTNKKIVTAIRAVVASAVAVSAAAWSGWSDHDTAPEFFGSVSQNGNWPTVGITFCEFYSSSYRTVDIRHCGFRTVNPYHYHATAYNTQWEDIAGEWNTNDGWTVAQSIIQLTSDPVNYSCYAQLY